MSRLEHILLYDLRDSIEGGVLAFYFLTAGIGPSLLGYFLGRWAPVYLRALPIPFILSAGVYWTLNSDHWFEIYILGNLLYVSFLIRGLKRRAHDNEVRFWSLPHFDWIAIGLGTIIMMLLYRFPSA
jgi:hypothetical protein